MKDNSLLKLGGICAILIGITGVLASLTYLLLPADQRLGVPAARILPSIAQSARLLNLQFLELALIGILGFAVVPAISSMVREGHEGWVTWTSNLALLGFAVAAVSNLFTFGRLPKIAAAFVAGDASTKAALAPIWRSSLDLHGVWGYGVVGLWIFVVSLLASRSGAFPKGLAYLGLAAGLAYLLIPAGLLFAVPALILIAATLGGALSAIWFIWVGLVARRHAQ